MDKLILNVLEKDLNILADDLNIASDIDRLYVEDRNGKQKLTFMYSKVINNEIALNTRENEVLLLLVESLLRNRQELVKIDKQALLLYERILKMLRALKAEPSTLETINETLERIAEKLGLIQTQPIAVAIVSNETKKSVEADTNQLNAVMKEANQNANTTNTKKREGILDPPAKK